MKTKKICFILPEVFPVPAVCGGAIETLVTSLIERHTNDSEFEFTVCSVYHQQAAEAYKKLNNHSVKLFWTHPEKLRNKTKQLLFRLFRKIFKINLSIFRKHYGEIAKLLSREKFDLIIAEGGSYETIIQIAKKYKKEQLVIHVHHHYIPNKFVAQNYGVVIGVSDFVTKEYKQYCEKEVINYTLKNAIDITKFSKKVGEEEKADLRAKLGFEEKDFIVLYVGRIIDVKGVKELMEAITSITDSCVKLLMIGSPNFSAKDTTPYLEDVQRLTEQYSERIIYTGYTKNDKIYKYAAIADIQCVPSLWEEAAGLVVLEAMASGLPTVITNSGGMVEYVTDNTSIVVNRGESLVHELQEAILYLKENNEIREKMSRASREHVKQYDEKKYYQNFIQIMNNILEKEE